MAFHDVRFPDNVSYGSSGGPSYKTDIVELSSGAEERNERWTNPRHRYNVGYGVKSYEDLLAVKTFFIARRGAANGFRYKDFLDFTTAADGVSEYSYDDVQIGLGDGTTVQFQLKKFYESGGVIRTRNLFKIVEASVALDGIPVDPGDYTINLTNGIITFDTAPGADVPITAGCEFDVPVRFVSNDGEWLQVSHDDYSDGSIQNIELVELLDGTATAEEMYMGGALVLDPMTANRTLNYNDGRVVVVKPNASGKKIILPDPEDGTVGGPHFFIINTSTSQTVAVEYPSGTNIATIAVAPSQYGGSGRTFCIAPNSSGDPEWRYL